MLREARALAKLNHEHIVPVLDVGSVEGHFFIATVFVEGWNLEAWLKENRRWQDALAILIKAGEGLAAVHRAGFVHRDFKPQNVLVGRDGSVRVTDFGISWSNASITEAESAETHDVAYFQARGLQSLTDADMVLGTPAYMAPEQFRQRRVDAKADQYSFCISLYQALYGTRPFHSNDATSLIQAKLNGPWFSHEDHRNKTIPMWLGNVVRKGLHPDPRKRWKSMDALIRRLRSHTGRRVRLVTAAAVLSLVTGASSWFYLENQVTKRSCSGGDSKVSNFWNDEMKKRIQTAFIDTGLSHAPDTWHRVSKSLDTYTKDWATMYRDACEATHLKKIHSEKIFDLRMRCLDHDLWRAEAVTQAFMTANAEVVDKAVSALTKLRPVSFCGDVLALQAEVVPPVDFKLRKQVELTQKRLLEVDSLFLKGAIEDAIELARLITVQARDLQYLPLQAEALIRLATGLEFSGQYKKALITLQEAFRDSIRSRSDRIAAEAGWRIMFIEGARLANKGEARVWHTITGSIIRRFPSDPVMKAQLHSNWSGIASISGEHKHARNEAKKAVALLELHHPNHPELPGFLNNLGVAEHGLGLFHNAKESYKFAINRATRILGPLHPATCVATVNYYSIAGENEAESGLNNFLESCGSSLGSQHPWVGAAYRDLGWIHFKRGNLIRAQGLFEKAHKAFQSAYGQENYITLATRSHLARCFEERGLLDKALEYYQQLLSIDSPQRVRNIVGLARVFIQLDRVNEAFASFTRALDLVQADSSPTPWERGLVKLWIAKALTQINTSSRKRMLLFKEAKAHFSQDSSPEAKDCLYQLRPFNELSVGIRINWRRCM